MRILACIGIALALPLSTGAARAQELTEGLYTCTIGSFMLGQILIAGGRYAGPAYDQQFEADHPFTTDGPTITWGGPVGGISDAGTIVATVMKDAGGGRIGFDITIQNGSGNFQTVSCSPD